MAAPLIWPRARRPLHQVPRYSTRTKPKKTRSLAGWPRRNADCQVFRSTHSGTKHVSRIGTPTRPATPLSLPLLHRAHEHTRCGWRGVSSDKASCARKEPEGEIKERLGGRRRDPPTCPPTWLVPGLWCWDGGVWVWELQACRHGVRGPSSTSLPLCLAGGRAWASLIFMEGVGVSQGGAATPQPTYNTTLLSISHAAPR